MKRLSLALALSLAGGLLACQRPAAPERTAEGPSPSPTASPALPPEAPLAPPAESEAATPSPAAPAPARREAPARRAPAEPAPAREAVAPPALVPGPVTQPTPAPTPTPRPRVLRAGTVLPIVLKAAISTKTASPEDPVVAELAEDVVRDGDVILPAGAEVLGHVVSSVRSGRVKGRARLVVSFDRIRVDGRTLDVDATGFDVTAESSKGKDAKIAGGAAAAGAIIGAIADGGSGALKGGAIGGAAGGAAVLATRGKEVELPAGSRYKIEVKTSLRLD
jgi:hypothetical protein